jgi:hypothetical protein
LPNQRWLIQQGRDDEALAVVRLLHAGSGESEEFIQEEFTIMRDTIRAEVAIRSNKISDLWGTRSMTKRTAVACGIQAMAQLTGINVLAYYGPVLYTQLGITGHNLLLIQGIYSVVGTIATLIFMTIIIDKVGRKLPLVVGGYLLAGAFAGLAAVIHILASGGGNHHVAQKAGLAMVFIISALFSMSFASVSWVMPSEVFPIRTRSMGVAAATCCNWAFNVLLPQVSPLGMNSAGWKYVLSLLSVLIVLMSICLFLDSC